MITAGYSGTPLAKKLGIKENFTIKLINAPDHYFSLFTDFPPNVNVMNDNETKKDCIHYFATKAASLTRNIILLKKELKPDGMLWVSWYKKSAKMQTDITENMIRDVALKNGLVDIKVCAVDELWSALKLVKPIKDR